MPSIKFDNSEILTTTYVPRFVKHESQPAIELNAPDLSHDDGAVLISERKGIKVISLQGILVGTSEPDLEAKIDAFKEIFSRVQKNLDLSWNGGTRRYVASCRKHDFDRDHFHILFVPWTAEFVCLSGIGEDTTETSLVGATTFTTQVKALSNLNFLGSARPKPRIRVQNTGTLSSVAKGIEIKNVDTGERMVLTNPNGLIQTYDFELDCRLKRTNYFFSPSAPYQTYGVFPSFVPGNANNIEVKIGDLIAEAWEAPEGYSVGGGGGYAIYGNTVVQEAQAFMVPYTDATFQGISVFARRGGTPGTDLVVTIEGDSGGHPDGTPIATFTIAAANIDAFFDWRFKNADSGTAFTLNANTRYWLRCKTSGGDGSNFYEVMAFEGRYATYKKGFVSSYQSGVGNWIDFPNTDFMFRIHNGGRFDNTKTYQVMVDYYKRWL